MITNSYKRILYPGLWIFLFLIQIVLIYNFKSIEEAILRGVVNTSMILFIYYFNKYLVNNYYDKKNFKKYLIYESIMIISVSLLRRGIEIIYFDRFVFIFQSAESKEIPLNTVALLFNFFATITISFFSSLYFVGEKNKALEIKHNTLKFENLQNKMEMLNNQLSSHFLFNSLNDIYASAILKKGETPEMILKLSNIMKFITYDSNLNEIFFYTEIQQAKNYISFFEIKSKNKLTIDFKEDNNSHAVLVMPMLLIPLIENALKHGNLNDTDNEAFLKIDVSYTKYILKITVRNSRQSMETDNLSNGIGISNYKRRLELRYPDKHIFRINLSENFFEATVTLTL